MFHFRDFSMPSMSNVMFLCCVVKSYMKKCVIYSWSIIQDNYKKKDEQHIHKYTHLRELSSLKKKKKKINDGELFTVLLFHWTSNILQVFQTSFCSLAKTKRKSLKLFAFSYDAYEIVLSREKYFFVHKKADQCSVLFCSIFEIQCISTSIFSVYNCFTVHRFTFHLVVSKTTSEEWKCCRIKRKISLFIQATAKD